MICNKPKISFWVWWQVPLGQEFRSSTLICKTALHQVSFPRKANHKVVFLSLIWLLFCELLSSWTLQSTEGVEDVASPWSVVIKNTGLQWILLIQREILAGVIWFEGSEERGGDHECAPGQRQGAEFWRPRFFYYLSYQWMNWWPCSNDYLFWVPASSSAIEKSHVNNLWNLQFLITIP